MSSHRSSSTPPIPDGRWWCEPVAASAPIFILVVADGRMLRIFVFSTVLSLTAAPPQVPDVMAPLPLRLLLWGSPRSVVIHDAA